MNLNNAVEKFFLSNTIDDVRNPGIFVFDDVSKYIKKNIKDGNNLGVEKFIAQMKLRYKERLDYYVPIIVVESRSPSNEVMDKIEKRLMNTYHGIFAEAILEKMYSASQMYEIIPIKPEEDYGSYIDLKVKDRTDGSILNLQVKTIRYLLNPSPYQIYKLEEEKKVHKKLNLNVAYAYFNHDFNNRYFIFENIKLPIYGYGKSNVRDLEKVTFDLFNKMNEKSREEELNELIF